MLLELLVFLYPSTVSSLSCDLTGSDWSLESNIPANQLPDVVPIIGKKFREEVKNTSRIKLKGKVPGYVLVDLHNIGIISNPIHENNDVRFRPLSLLTWKYSKIVELHGLSKLPRIILDFEGIDTFADIIINKKYYPEDAASQNQFKPRRLILDSNYLTSDTILIEVIIRSAVTEATRLAGLYAHSVPPIQFPEVQHGEKHRNFVRKSPASFSWDWGPAFMSQGIWKPVMLYVNQTYVPVAADHRVPVKSVQIRKCDNGESWCIAQNLVFDCLDIKCGVEITNVSIALYNTTHSMTVKSSITKGVRGAQLFVNITSEVPLSEVSLWYPRFYGNTSTYNLTTTITTPLHSYSQTSLIGFKTVQLLQQPISCDHPDKICKSFEIKVNDKIVYVKGANLVPSSSFESEDGACIGSRLDKLLSLSDTAGINTLRVWGGGLYLPNCFYEEASRRGIMIWQEFMFACSMYPTNKEFLQNVQEEVTIQVRRLNRYPCLIMFGGNNENKQAIQQDWYGTSLNYTLFVSEYQQLYEATIRENIKNIIDVPFVMTSPSNGETGEKWAQNDPNSELSGDVHFYNYQPDCLSVGGRIFPIPRFASEFGYQSYPAIQTMREALNVDNLVLADKNTEHRQHLVMGNGLLYAQINFMFGKRELEDLRNENLSYLSQLYQAICMTAEISHYRRFYRTLTEDGRGWNSGVMFWQLNDIWAAPTWSSIDVNMNPKMLYYAIKDLYQPVISVSIWNGSDVLVYGINELEHPVTYDLDIFLVSPPNKTIANEWAKDGTLQQQSVSLIYTISDDDTSQYCSDLDNCVFAVEFSSQEGASKITNMVVPAFSWEGIQVKNPQLKPQIMCKDLQQGKVLLKIVAYEFAFWIYLEADRPGTFSHNLFSMYGMSEKIIEFSLLEPIPDGSDCCNFTVTSFYHHQKRKITSKYSIEF